MFPVETILAVFPSTVAVGKLTLRPLTLYHVMAMESLGIDTDGTVADEQVYMAAWILSKRPEDVPCLMKDGDMTAAFEAWFRKVEPSFDETLAAVKEVFSQAYLPYVPCEQKEEAVQNMPTGYGWPLEMAEAYAAGYGVTLEEAMCVPMCRMFGMMACARKRNGGKAGGPDYYERIMVKAIARMKGKAADDGK